MANERNPLNEATRRFVRQHADDDVRRLALQAHPDDVDMPMALDQIQGRQTARRKLPTWAATDGIIYPPHLSMEQCSSEQTAQYKAQLLARLLSENFLPSTIKRQTSSFLPPPSSLTFADLTGGFGVDFVAMAKELELYRDARCEVRGARNDFRLVYVEQNEHLCEIARNNFPLLGLPAAEVVCATAEEFFHHTSYVKHHTSNVIVFLDPARRNKHGARTYGIADCTPNVLALVDALRIKADMLMLKLSPMLDWHRAIEDLKPLRVSEVHIVSVGNECKELLLVIPIDRQTEITDSSSEQNAEANPVSVFCVNDDNVFQYEYPSSFKHQTSSFLLLPSSIKHPPSSLPLPPSSFLYVPNASIMKAGCFDELCHHYGLVAVGQNSHLFVLPPPSSLLPPPSFEAGRRFVVKAVSTLNKRELKKALSGITHANIATRNFPMTADELRRRLKIKDGGDIYLFATTLDDRSHVIFICSKEP